MYCKDDIEMPKISISQQKINFLTARKEAYREAVKESEKRSYKGESREASAYIKLYMNAFEEAYIKNCKKDEQKKFIEAYIEAYIIADKKAFGRAIPKVLRAIASYIASKELMLVKTPETVIEEDEDLDDDAYTIASQIGIVEGNDSPSSTISSSISLGTASPAKDADEERRIEERILNEMKIKSHAILAKIGEYKDLLQSDFGIAIKDTLKFIEKNSKAIESATYESAPKIYMQLETKLSKLEYEKDHVSKRNRLQIKAHAILDKIEGYAEFIQSKHELTIEETYNFIEKLKADISGAYYDTAKDIYKEIENLLVRIELTYKIDQLLNNIVKFKGMEDYVEKQRSILPSISNSANFHIKVVDKIRDKLEKKLAELNLSAEAEISTLGSKDTQFFKTKQSNIKAADDASSTAPEDSSNNTNSL